jgi:hypothetical protein
VSADVDLLNGYVSETVAALFQRAPGLQGGGFRRCSFIRPLSNLGACTHYEIVSPRRSFFGRSARVMIRFSVVKWPFNAGISVMASSFRLKESPLKNLCV